MPVEVKIPEVGESITEGFLAEWLQPDGAVVAVEDPLLVLETDKITVNVNAEHAGKLAITIAEGETVEVGQVVATIDTDAAEAPAATPMPAAATAPAPFVRAGTESCNRGSGAGTRGSPTESRTAPGPLSATGRHPGPAGR